MCIFQENGRKEPIREKGIKKKKNKIFIYSTDNKLWNTYENKILANLNNETEYEYLFFKMGILGITCFSH